MEWRKYTIHTTADAEDAVAGALYELGYDSIEIEDRQLPDAKDSGGLFGDVVPDWDGSDTGASVSFYTDMEEDPAEVRARVEAELAALAELQLLKNWSITEDVTREEDWINRWKEHFHSFYVDDILILPGWEEEAVQKDGKAALVLHIDPGTAFGTGAHESTKLAIRAIRKYLRPGDRVLDIGTGSGILGIVALKSGAESVFGTDLDEHALPAVEENISKNDVDDGAFTRVLGNIADDPAIQEAAGYDRYDLCCANIIAEILETITPQVPAHLKKGAYYITSGILREKEELVIKAAEKAGMTPVEILREGEWSGIVFRR